MTEPACLRGRIANLRVGESRDAGYVTQSVMCTKGNTKDCFILPAPTDVLSHRNRVCKQRLIETFSRQRKGSNKMITTHEDSREEFQKEMNDIGKCGSLVHFWCCRRFQLRSPTIHRTCYKDDNEKILESRGGNPESKRKILSFLRFSNISALESSSETLTLDECDSSRSSTIPRDVRRCESCRNFLDRYWFGKKLQAYQEQSSFCRWRTSAPNLTAFRHFSYGQERSLLPDKHSLRTEHKQLIQEKTFVKCEQFRKVSSSFETKTDSNRSPHTNRNYGKSDVSKRKVPRLNKTRIRPNNAFHLIFSWIIASMGFLLHGCRDLACSTTYRKSNVLTKNCITFALWTLIILPGDSKRVLGNSLLISPGQFCTRARNLNARQQGICENYSHILKHVEEGVVLGSHRCQKEFQYNRWNCSSAPRSFYSRLLIQDIRETAYVTAVTSAAITYAVTYACSKGEIEDCGCAEKSINSYDLLKAEAIKRNIEVSETQLRRAAATFEWGGCSDVVEYGEQVSELFTNHFGRRFQGRDLKGKIEEHNLEAGRLAITNYMRKECRCHGLTGSCTFKTCWEKMPKWQDVSARIREQFDGAVRVQLANDGRELLPTRKQRLAIKQYPYPRQPYPDLSLSRRMKRASSEGHYPIRTRRSPGVSVAETGRRRRRRKRYKNLKKRRGGDRTTVVEEENLVYSQESPNFCRRVRKHGTLGTSGRRCTPNATGAGSCDYLCCGRPYTQHQVTITNRCNCRLEYCCKVVCDECTSQETIYTCE